MEPTPIHETKLHGIITFPYSVYMGRIPEWIPSFPLHWHDDFEFIYCAKGQIQVTLWGQAHTLCANDLIVILPHAVHSIEQGNPEGGEYFNIMFHPSIFHGSENDLCYDKYVLPFLNGEKTMECFYPAGSCFNQTVTPCIQAMLTHRKESYTTYELLIKSSLFFLLHHMNLCSTAATSDNSQPQLSYSRLKNALYYVQKFYDRNITIKRAAEECGFSESHFMKLFKEFTGMSFNAYLVNYRLELAAKQLAETDSKVIDIMQNCGFHNQSYFTRAFQKKYRKPPLLYRKSARRNKH
ncbi:MAG: AraC family transcriptional regulator [Lachnospiraceae bacterium]|nr:AraC family transcriptional regulator [Lachnospiraceae bacterium]MDE7271510.1 AraC family transcriptional regulator [Lachnospiraceae bacterium]